LEGIVSQLDVGFIVREGESNIGEDRFTIRGWIHCWRGELRDELKVYVRWRVHT
jgi:hypothetical protein